MLLKVVSQDGGVLRMELQGRICQQELAEVGDPFVALLGEDAYTWKLLLGLDRAESIDSLGVAWLLKCHKRFREDGGVMVLHSVPPTILHVIKILQLNKVFNLAESLAAAHTVATGASA
ncbi:MAG: STAS domain-containing protein [Pirellulales bacterium]